MNWSPPGSSIHGILQARILQWEEIYSPPKLNQEEIDHLTRQLIRSEREFVKILQTSPGWDRTSQVNSSKPIKSNMFILILLKPFQRIKEKGKFPDILWRHNHPENHKQMKDSTKKESYRPMSLMTIDEKILNKVSVNQIQKHIKKITHHDQVGFIPSLQVWLLLLLLSRLSRVRLCVTPWTAAHQAPPSLGFSRQEHWSGLPFPSPVHESEKWKWSHSVMCNS